MNIAVVVITYKRPAGLRKLLLALIAQNLEGTSVERLNVIVVDNDPAGSAKVIVDEFPDTGPVRITRLHETRQGIPFARNRGMHHALDDNDYFAFIDDDEYPTPSWISSLILVASEQCSDAVLGPVIPVFPDDTPSWIRKSRIFEGWHFADRAQIGEAASNNVLVRCAFIRRHGIEFDERMRMSGGSDYRFFRECVESGMLIHWACNAAVFEDIPRSRTELRWMAQRQIRLGNTFAVDARLSRRLPRIARLYAVGIGRVLLGALALPLTFISSRRGTNAAIHLLRGVGIISGIHGYRHDEYDPNRLNRERTAA